MEMNSGQKPLMEVLITEKVIPFNSLLMVGILLQEHILMDIRSGMSG